MKLRTKHREAEIRRNARTNYVADYMKLIMSAAAIPPSLQPAPTFDIQFPKRKAKSRRETQSDITGKSVAGDLNTRPSEEIIYEKPKRGSVRDVDDDYDDGFFEEDAKKLVVKT